MYAFVSHESACAALRLLSSSGLGMEGLNRWPAAARRLPPVTECVSGQRDFRRDADAALVGVGVTDRPIDLLVPERRARSSGKTARFHLWSRVIPAESMLEVGPGLLISGPELIIAQLCGAQGKLDALLDAHVDAVRAEVRALADFGLDERPVVDHPLEWERIRRLVAAVTVACEFAGTYRLGRMGEEATYRLRPITNIDSLRRVIAQTGEPQGTQRALRACELALEGAASPLETSLALMLTLPVDYGGFGLEKPLLNCPVDVSRSRGGVSDRDVVTPDFLWVAARVALEYDSAAYHDRAGKGRREEDAVRANILAALGYRVLRATPGVIRSLAGVSLLARQLACALGCELAVPTPVQDLRRRKLYAQLMPRLERDGT